MINDPFKAQEVCFDYTTVTGYPYFNVDDDPFVTSGFGSIAGLNDHNSGGYDVVVKRYLVEGFMCHMANVPGKGEVPVAECPNNPPT